MAVTSGMTTTSTPPANRQKRDMGRKVKKSNITDLGFPIIKRKKKRS